VLLVADIKVGHEWFTLQAYMEEGRVFLSKGAHLGLDYTKLFPEDFVDQWPEFIQPLRAIAEVLA
jgi:hypothetical protein